MRYLEIIKNFSDMKSLHMKHQCDESFAIFIEHFKSRQAQNWKLKVFLIILESPKIGFGSSAFS